MAKMKDHVKLYELFSKLSSLTLYKGVSSKSVISGVPWKTIRDVPKNDTSLVTCISSLSFPEFVLVCPPATATRLSICAQGSEGRHFMNWFVLASVTGN